MLAKQYIAKDEFELYGTLAGTVEGSDFREGFCAIYCFAQSSPGMWELAETFQTAVVKEFGEFFQSNKQFYFLVASAPDGAKYEVTFNGQFLSILSECKEGHFTVLDFEDLKPNQAFLEFEKNELKTSLEFLKKLFQEE